MNKRVLLSILAFILLVSCKKDFTNSELKYVDIISIPIGFPYPEFPFDNNYSYDRWRLGKELFYSNLLSRDESINCSSCHHQEIGFSDNLPLSLGVDDLVGSRNAPTLTNVVYNLSFTREGGVTTLEQQIAIPIQEHNEFDFNIVDIADRLNLYPDLVEMSQNAYERDFDPFVITRAISTFERSLISGNSNYDKFYFQGNETSLNESEKAGMNLFFGDAKCVECHGGFNFTNNGFENNGLYEIYADSGKFRLTNLEEDIARFKVPTIRNIELTGPYMHDGSIDDLEGVIEHYSSGIKEHQNKNPILENLNLSEEEKNNLLNFLKTLTDYEFINNIKFRKE